MKNYSDILKKWLIFWIWISISVLITWIVYAALSHVSSWTTLTSDMFNSVIDATVPTWWIMAFNLSTCPTWWLPADWASWTPDLRWEFIRWLDNWRWVDNWRTLNSWQTPSIVPFSWSPGANVNSLAQSVNNPSAAALSLNFGFDKATSTNYNGSVINQVWTSSFTGISLSTWWNAAVRPRNVALLYCVKQ